MQGLDASQVRLAVDMATGDLLIRAASGEEMRIVGQNTGTGIEQIVFADGTTWGQPEIANATLEYRGTDSNDVLVGTSGVNWMDGGAGDDELHGMDGSDTYVMSSGGGNDRVVDYGAPWDVDTVSVQGFDASQVRLIGDMATGDLLIRATSGEEMRIVDQNTGMGIEQIVFADGTIWGKLEIANATLEYRGTAGNDVLVGTSDGDWMDGGAGDDQLVGNSGNDVLIGGAGADVLQGGEGSDTYEVDQPGDVVIETDANAVTGGVDTVNSYLSAYTLGANVENGAILMSGNANLTGNALNNVIEAGAFNNVIDGGKGIDTASYAAAGVGVSVSLSTTKAQVTGGSGTDTLLRVENLAGSAFGDKLTGNSVSNLIEGGAGNDYLAGQGGSDSLSGGTGDDVLIGGVGADRLTGGQGRDVFDFNALTETGTTSTSWDLITDFESGIDCLDLSSLDANQATSANDGFSQMLAAGASFTQAGQLMYSNGVLYGNTDGDAAAEFAIGLSAAPELTMSDIVL
ncbi:Poly(beta-D-mannuronate) C5 epimerase 7 [Azoarcus sp. Aa7]|nr:Poly(beta-D-mannuronate) C5 epimerase 7 [Azoarcus sp. Aa7]